MDRFVRLEPNNPDGREARGNLRANGGDIPAPLRTSRRRLNWLPRAVAWYNRGSALVHASKDKEAIRDYTEAERLGLNRPPFSAIVAIFGGKRAMSKKRVPTLRRPSTRTRRMRLQSASW